jgi:hypothetical protein
MVQPGCTAAHEASGGGPGATDLAEPVEGRLPSGQEVRIGQAHGKGRLKGTCDPCAGGTLRRFPCHDGCRKVKN